MAAPTPLKDLELIDCAKANAKQGIETATELCGYGNDTNTFKQELKKACDRIGVEFHEMSDLITDQQTIRVEGGVEIAPDTPSEL